MNRKTALALIIASAAAGTAFADDITMAPPFTSTLSTAQVQAELQQFRQAGVDPWADGYNQLDGFKSTRSAAEVRAEYIAERDKVAAFNGEDSGAQYMARRDAKPRTVGLHLASRMHHTN
jgi:hypothetical protein